MALLLLALSASICLGLWAITRATIELGLTVRETIGTDAAGLLSPTQNTVTVNGGNVSESLTPSTTPAVTVHAFGVLTLSSGSGTLDLRTLTGLNGVAVDLNGLKPRAILFTNTGANPMTIVEGASNGYPGLGASASITIPAGCSAMFYFAAAGTAVGATDKTLDVTGTGSQVLEYQIVAGA